MKKRILLIGLLATFVSVYAQQVSPVLLTVDGKTTSLSEFEAIFKKNNSKDTKITTEAINEYLDLYIKFKLKVREAEVLGYDTTASFVQELESYRKQLVQPYLTDREVSENLIKEAYERMKYDVNASHILVSLDPNAQPKDTLIAFNKIMKIRDRIVKGEDIGKVALETSEDPSAKENNGNLGYFNVLHMVYPFETAVYTTEIGKISMPVRTRFGYHIVKVNDKRPARGTIKVAHIMVQAARELDEATQKARQQKIEEVYQKLADNPDSFVELVQQFSDDKTTTSRNGELPPFSTGKMVPEFENAAFALQNNGDFSKPIRTDYGWHIIKRIDLIPLESYESIYNSLKSRVSRDARSNKSKEVVIEKVKKENNFKQNLKYRDEFYKLINPEEYKNGAWTASKAQNLNKVMFGLYAADGEKLEYNQTEFAQLIEKNKPRPNTEVNVVADINKLYEHVVEEKVLKFKEDRLPKTSEEYRLLFQEYRDGILLFNLTDAKVWSKAIIDTSGIENFMKTNQANYMWNQRVEAVIYKCLNDSVADKLMSILNKKSKKPLSNDEILKQINSTSQLYLSIEEGKYEKGDNSSIDATEQKVGIKNRIKNKNGVDVVVVKSILKAEPKKLEEIKGQVTSDYQNFLEQEWVKELKAKYKVEVNQDVLKQIK